MSGWQKGCPEAAEEQEATEQDKYPCIHKRTNIRTNTRTITTQTEWQLSRNQQCNWETVNQVISLRTLPECISTPIVDSAAMTWSFEFDVVDPGSVAHNNNPVGYLLADCDGVPMMTGLGESSDNATFLSSQGTAANIWFDVVQQIDHK